MMTHPDRAFPVAAPAAAGALFWLASTGASAANGTKARIPVNWSGTPCMTIVDRSSDPVLHLDYSIEREDVGLTDDEVSDSRAHQFFALCRSYDPQQALPRWITQADVDRAAQAGAVIDDVDPQDVFETSTQWADCWHRINADDDRRPITFAAAAAGVEWDASTVPAGTYLLAGYTWEPAFNIWSPSPGVVKVVDDPALTSSEPAIAITTPETSVLKNETIVIEGCVSAMEGSTITAYWGRAQAEVTWEPFVEDVPVQGESFVVELAPPEVLVGESAMIRVDVTDPTGRRHTNFMRELVIVLGIDGPSDCGGGFIGGPDCADSGEAGDTAGDTTGVAPPALDGGDDSSAAGCGCRPHDDPSPLGAGLGLLVLWGRRRPRARDRGRRPAPRHPTLESP